MPKTLVHIHPLNQSAVTQATAICTRAMLDNPIHQRVFGDDPQRRAQRLTRFFTAANTYIQRRGCFLGAEADGNLIGVLGLLPPGHCRPSLRDALGALPALAAGNSPWSLFGLSRWLGAWARHDLAEPHWHLGPLAIEPEFQRRGVGGALMRHAMALPELAGRTLYLETDKPGNVAFYQGFGFRVVGQLPILGAEAWLMRTTP